ncbi:uncharacterized protein LOC116343000 [Contarinia nasturtii]|uniref:uncharacterized protein LOC116343000 n=1 Tax=Contarinia nasturtii TaxID=265458 RepID=UPI0012D43C75|nr:uncharacterized protein LOC116343000 [Contarinia nasturtii]XP_031626719.1 uncharacterized protein LOC116343000 [Contarinia nasturtii]XP_031626720.1 uncharacterized protein LOC116343000 [Contarinia nasturtii]
MEKTSSKLITNKESAQCQHDELATSSSGILSQSSIAGSKLKRKCQHEISHLCSKEKKISDDEKTPTEFNDMCDNVIDIILCHLNLEDLANISDTNKRLRNIAGSVFSRKHGNHLISFDAFHYVPYKPVDYVRRIYENRNLIYCENKLIVRISDAIIWFKLMRNFGESIKFICIHCSVDTNIPIVLKNVFKYVCDYCADSLEALELHSFPFFTLNKPLIKLQEFIARTSFFDLEALELMPNLRSLNLSYAPKSVEKYFLKLERVSLIIESDEEVHSFISFLQMNRQIKYLHLCMQISNYNDLIYSSIDENLTQLKTFKLTVCYRGKQNAPELIPTYRFKTIETFSYDGWSCGRIIESYEFDNLQKCHLKMCVNMHWMNFILRNKKLKILKFFSRSASWIEKNNVTIRKLLDELTELEQIDFEYDIKEKHLILKEILGNEWEQIQMKEIASTLKSIWKSKFRRIPKIQKILKTND